VREHVGRVAAVARDARGALNVLARERVVVSTLRAVTARAREPADADARPHVPALDFRPDGLQGTDDFVTRYARILHARRVATHRERVAVAYAAGLNAYQHLARARAWNVALLLLHPGARLRDCHRSHRRHGSSLAWSAPRAHQGTAARPRAKPGRGRGLHADFDEYG